MGPTSLWRLPLSQAAYARPAALSQSTGQTADLHSFSTTYAQATAIVAVHYSQSRDRCSVLQSSSTKLRAETR